MKVYAVASWDNYYPCPDNVYQVFLHYEDAVAFKKELEIEHRTNMLERDRYGIFTYDVNTGEYPQTEEIK